MEDVSLHVLDIVENSIRAEATRVSVKIAASTASNTLDIEINDNGKGMDEEQIKSCEDPFFTTKLCKKTGLGISFLKQSAAEANGTFSILSEKTRGTTVRASFQLDHLDRRPMGDIARTFYILIAAFPDVDFFFEYRKDLNDFVLDTGEIGKDLGEVPISAPDVLKALKELINDGISSVGKI